jgi:hypothetical protein
VAKPNSIPPAVTVANGSGTVVVLVGCEQPLEIDPDGDAVRVSAVHVATLGSE